MEYVRLNTTVVSSAAVIRVVTQHLVGEKRCVMTLLTAAEDTRRQAAKYRNFTILKCCPLSSLALTYANKSTNEAYRSTT